MKEGAAPAGSASEHVREFIRARGSHRSIWPDDAGFGHTSTQGPSTPTEFHDDSGGAAVTD
jgi:hypothetical protein